MTTKMEAIVINDDGGSKDTNAFKTPDRGFGAGPQQDLSDSHNKFGSSQQSGSFDPPQGRATVDRNSNFKNRHNVSQVSLGWGYDESQETSGAETKYTVAINGYEKQKKQVSPTDLRFLMNCKEEVSH